MSYIKALENLRKQVNSINPVEEAAQAVVPVNPRGFIPSIRSGANRAEPSPTQAAPQYDPLMFAKKTMGEIQASQNRFQENLNKQKAATQASNPVASAATSFVSRRGSNRDAEEAAATQAYEATTPTGRSPQEASGPTGSVNSDYITYSNSNATRNDPLSDDLVQSMSFLSDMGITMDVISGGQESNRGGQGTGSTRHNHGNSADADFYLDGRKLDWNNPEDVPIFQEIVRRARDNGVTDN